MYFNGVTIVRWVTVQFLKDELGKKLIRKRSTEPTGEYYKFLAISLLQEPYYLSGNSISQEIRECSINIKLCIYGICGFIKTYKAQFLYISISLFFYC
jgi:hypothetical protein